MLEFDVVFERLKDILSKELGDKKVYNKDIASALGISAENLSMMKRRGKLPVKEILDFCAKRSISINWLLYDQHPHSLEEPTEKYIYLKYFKEINASAGGGAFNYETKMEKIVLDRELIRIIGAAGRLRDIEAINLIGDSMEPTLKDGSMVFVDTSQTDIKNGGIFVIVTGMGLFVKRVVLKLGGKVVLLSDNKEYAQEELSVDDIRIKGRVIGVMEKI